VTLLILTDQNHHQMEKVLLEYIDTNFVKECQTVEYFDPQIGKGGLKLEITKLQNGYTKVINLIKYQPLRDEKHPPEPVRQDKKVEGSNHDEEKNEVEGVEKH